MRYHIETRRLVLRELLPSDEDGLLELESDPRVHEFLGKKPVTDRKRIREVIAYVNEQYRENGLGRLAVILKESGAFLGWSGLKYETNIRDFPYYDLGYRLIPKYWGQGIATESAIASLRFGFEELRLEAIHAAADVRNLASNRVLVKSGLKPAGQFTFEGELCNWYGLSRSAWRKQH